jgi:hypothetical protein
MKFAKSPRFSLAFDCFGRIFAAATAGLRSRQSPPGSGADPKQPQKNHFISKKWDNDATSPPCHVSRET